MRLASRKVVVAVAVGGVLLLDAALAQSQTTQTEASDQLTEITVTGSRLITNGNEAPTPVTVISTEQLLAARPNTLFTDLTALPVFSGSQGAGVGVDNSPTNGAVSALNLRDLGPQRALILWDGNRVPATTPNGIVDVNSLPQMLIRRVDVVTGGASAIYGSDAVTGVVNFITDTKFDGIKINLQRGISSYGDAGSYVGGLAFGQDLFGGRGHIEGSVERHSADGLLSADRSWGTQRWTLQGNGTTSPYHAVAGAVNNSGSFGGTIVCPAGTPGSGTPIASGCPSALLVGQNFADNGVATPFIHGSTAGITNPSDELGGSGAYYDDISVLDDSRQDQGFLRFDYDLTGSIHADVVGSASYDYTAGVDGGQRSLPPGWKLGACDAYLALQYQQALGCTATSDPTFTFNKLFLPSSNYGVAQNDAFQAHNFYLLGQLTGTVGSDYHWSSSLTHSENSQTVAAENQNLNNMYAALDAVVNPANGQIVCRVTLTNPTQYPGCVPLNPFGPSATSQAAINYTFQPIYTYTTTILNDLSASITGSPLRDWAGPVEVALSTELRRNTLELQSSSTPDQLLNCVGLMFGNCVAGVTDAHANTFARLPQVSQMVGEGAVEINVPLAKDLPVVKSLDFNAAGRYTRYNNASGNPNIPSPSFIANTWKMGLVWNVTDQLTLRWARSRDIRAPTLYDLFLPTQTTAASFVTDYLLPGQPVVTAAASTGGNTGLVPEVGQTTTLGIVYQPLRQWSMSLDYYDITIADALYSLSGVSSGVQQACYASGGTSPLCQLQARPFGCCSNKTSANSLSTVYTREVNVAAQKSWGADFETNFSGRLFDRALSLRLLVSYQPHLIYYIPLVPPVEIAGAATSTVLAGPGVGNNNLSPAAVWRGSAFAHFELTQHWGLDASERFRSSLAWSTSPGALQVGDVASVAYTDMTVTYSIPSRAREFKAYLNVQNLFNTPPPPAPSAYGIDPARPGFPSWEVGDDVAGRYFTLGVRVLL